MRERLKLLRRTLLSSAMFWRLKGSRPPPPPALKRRTIRRIAGKYGLRVLVETGTWHGDTIAALVGYFDHVISIELGTDLASAAQLRFAGDPRVTILHGDSGVLLPAVLPQIGPAVFWLDAHYSMGDTARGDVETPIVAEMTAVLNHPGVVLIDDARCFGRDPDYPPISEIERLARNFGYTCTIKHDVIRLVPGDGKATAARNRLHGRELAR